MVEHFLTEADLVFSIGAGLTRTLASREIPPGKKIIQVTVDEQDINAEYHVDLAIIGDARLVLEQLIAEFRRVSPGRARPQSVEAEIAAVKQAWLKSWMPKLTSSEVPLNPYRVVWELSRALDHAAARMAKEAGIRLEPEKGLPDVRSSSLYSQSWQFEPPASTGTEPIEGFLVRALDALIDYHKELMHQSASATDNAVGFASAAMLAGAALAVVIGAAMALLITRSVVGPIQDAVRAAETVAAGDLRLHLKADRRDESGQLLAALQRMNDALVGIVGAVRRNADSVVLASGQIVQGSADLSQRTEQQASNLEQTAASMEELTATVNHNTETARQAAQLATGAARVAESGGQVVGRVVETMEQITASSKRIGDIISVIDGIAFQTNILALNAAVEAARAGEQGRGFAVVAGEVRSLAQRSAEAAREIKALIGSSVERVEAGNVLVGEAGRTMGEVVTQVQHVADLINEISTASEEQSKGIGQIGDAVHQLDDVTQQNAALVEQSAAAAEGLRHQAGQLAETVAAFRLDS